MSKEQWHWDLRHTNLFTPPQKEETKRFKCHVCAQKFVTKRERNKHVRKKHPNYKDPKFIPQTVEQNVQNEESVPRPSDRRPRKRVRKQSKEKKKRRKIQQNRRQLGLPVLLAKSKITERIFYAEAYKKEKNVRKKNRYRSKKTSKMGERSSVVQEMSETFSLLVEKEAQRKVL